MNWEIETDNDYIRRTGNNGDYLIHHVDDWFNLIYVTEDAEDLGLFKTLIQAKEAAEVHSTIRIV